MLIKIKVVLDPIRTNKHCQTLFGKDKEPVYPVLDGSLFFKLSRIGHILKFDNLLETPFLKAASSLIYYINPDTLKII